MKKKQKHVLRKRSRQKQGSVFLGFCSCIALCYLFGPIILAAALGDYHSAEKLYSTGISTTGTVTAIDSTGKAIIAAGNFVTITGQTLPFQFPIDTTSSAYVGETVAILYNPDSPYAPDGVFFGTRDEVWDTAKIEFFAGMGILLFAITGTIIVLVILRKARFDPYKNKFKRLKKAKPDTMPEKPLL